MDSRGSVERRAKGVFRRRKMALALRLCGRKGMGFQPLGSEPSMAERVKS